MASFDLSQINAYIQPKRECKMLFRGELQQSVSDIKHRGGDRQTHSLQVPAGRDAKGLDTLGTFIMLFVCNLVMLTPGRIYGWHMQKRRAVWGTEAVTPSWKRDS